LFFVMAAFLILDLPRARRAWMFGCVKQPCVETLED
jgi:hypothetical protein